MLLPFWEGSMSQVQKNPKDFGFILISLEFLPIMPHLNLHNSRRIHLARCDTPDTHKELYLYMIKGHWRPLAVLRSEPWVTTDGIYCKHKAQNWGQIFTAVCWLSLEQQTAPLFI